ncbi:MAG: hypothetical protein FRX49_00551 [Trebouxia sp. A1-2]|nr:MAG: hypothetical protein FRX49_00551 [Trebouxia sp. A1-2]
MQSDEPYGLYNKTKHDIRDTADKLYQLLADISYSKRAQLISPVRAPMNALIFCPRLSEAKPSALALITNRERHSQGYAQHILPFRLWHPPEVRQGSFTCGSAYNLLHLTI